MVRKGEDTARSMRCQVGVKFDAGRITRYGGGPPYRVGWGVKSSCGIRAAGRGLRAAAPRRRPRRRRRRRDRRRGRG